jgi:ubiquinone/menaquinone biosynthesis C-methylase UbiE
MLDPVPLHVEHARREAGEPPAFETRVGDARDLPYADETFDVVMLLGPLYHLRQSQDRLLALREARRVSKPSGFVFAAAISRYALPGDGSGTAGSTTTIPSALSSMCSLKGRRARSAKGSSH